MPVRPLNRDQGWLLPPRLDDLLSGKHAVRFVASFVDALEAREWAELGIELQGEERGAPAYHPRLLLSVWLYGFMTGVRSCRKLETACREQLPYLWLTGLQTPDHNTLWRFYQENRQGMQCLLKRTVKTALEAGFIDLALQAVDGSKVVGNAAKDRTFDASGLERLMARLEAAIDDIEAQNCSSDDMLPAPLPEILTQKQALLEKVKAALERVRAEEGRVNLTDPDADFVKGREGIFPGYNAQAVVSPLSEAAGQGGQLITAAAVTQDPSDYAQLLPMIEAAAANLGEGAPVTLADAGYHSGENLTALEQGGYRVLMPEAQARALTSPYHKDAFVYDPESDSYACPLGQKLHYAGSKRDRKAGTVRRYRAEPAVCRRCPAFGICTKDYRHGRALEVGPDDAALKQHRALMATEEAKALYRLRKELIEPTFGIIKEQQHGRRLLLRGLLNVEAEWSLLAVAFNLRMLAKIWGKRLASLLRTLFQVSTAPLQALTSLYQPHRRRLAT